MLEQRREPGLMKSCDLCQSYQQHCHRQTHTAKTLSKKILEIHILRTFRQLMLSSRERQQQLLKRQQYRMKVVPYEFLVFFYSVFQHLSLFKDTAYIVWNNLPDDLKTVTSFS